MKKRWVKGLLPLLCLLLTASCTGNGAAPNGTDSTSVESTGTSGENAALPDLTVTVISIGKADAILVETEGHSLLIDTGHLAAMTESVNMEITTVKGLKNKVLGGEGFFHTKVTGPGHIWIQTMPFSKLFGLIPTGN